MQGTGTVASVAAIFSCCPSHLFLRIFLSLSPSLGVIQIQGHNQALLPPHHGVGAFVLIITEYYFIIIWDLRRVGKSKA